MACNSSNFSLAEHVLRVPLTEERVRWFLIGPVDSILEILSITVSERNESASIKLLNICDKVTNEISEGRMLSDYKLSFEPDNERAIRNFYRLAFNSKMFDFILEFHSLFPTEAMNESISKWYDDNVDNDSVPSRFKEFVISLKRKALWEDNRDLGLVLLRTYKSRNCSEILEHIVSYVRSTDNYSYDFYCTTGSGGYMNMMVIVCIVSMINMTSMV